MIFFKSSREWKDNKNIEAVQQKKSSLEIIYDVYIINIKIYFYKHVKYIFINIHILRLCSYLKHFKSYCNPCQYLRVEQPTLDIEKKKKNSHQKVRAFSSN